MNARALAAEIQSTRQVLAELEHALEAGFEPSEVIAVCEAKVERLHHHLLRLKQRAEEADVPPRV